MPEVPTFRECGYDFINDTISMVAAPKGTPPAIVAKLDEAFRKAMDDPEFSRYMESVANEIEYRGHDATRRYLEEGYQRLGKMIKELKLPTDYGKK